MSEVCKPDEIPAGTDPQLARVLEALLSMVEQYCGTDKTTDDGRRFYDHCFMSAGEEACEVLEDFGVITCNQYHF